MARYDSVIRQAVTSALYKKMTTAGYEDIQAMIEDAVGETYCRLFQNNCRVLRRFKCRHENSIFAYLRIIALRVVSNQMRTYRRKYAMQKLQSLEAFEEKCNKQIAGCGWKSSRLVDLAAQSVECKVFEQMVRASLRLAFRDANVNRNFIIFKLHFLYGYHDHEIARIKGLGLSARGVGNTTDRIRHWLRQGNSRPKSPKTKGTKKPTARQAKRLWDLQEFALC
ncbi:MAG: hypothetical protein ONB44_04030 [candidate division KSB1 bacterium]|nr:hypothetical protein [candidate division KSB1 bacterium]MDZ7301299.1 hypothetical protein [candidate division KSB1 bacterium]MDZ7310816.1 hypothetical protein [candidate division KSB1 bacterium]